ncbi:hypothetical protein NPIL_112291 [Nephila pilipes]|uniref:Uncharacterized protein n=1 Tax=Nephila pilipes TaxID=299642 RepID=A0A8X6PG74_NEPPI|nr:hypothetical protein NPIL_112291 [Nephila pilipes]
MLEMEELREAIRNLKVKKQPSSDNIIPEFLRHLGPEAQNTLVLHYNIFWKEKTSIPTDWDRATVIPIHKKRKPIDDLD